MPGLPLLVDLLLIVYLVYLQLAHEDCAVPVRLTRSMMVEKQLLSIVIKEQVSVLLRE